MKTLYIIPVIAVMSFILLFNGCSASGKEQLSIIPLTGTEWKLETLNGKAVTLNSGNFITLKFSVTADKINGAAVCNTYFGGYVKSGESLKFSGIGSTKMMCDDNLNESDYFNALESVDAYNISAGKLNLLSGQKVILIFKEK